MKKILYTLSLVLLSLLLAGCSKQQSSTSSSLNKKAETGQTASKGISALNAWQKVKPEADKWSGAYKIARIQEVSTSSFANTEGKSNGWKFYLEECKKEGAFGSCAEAKTKSFYFYTEKTVGEKKGISSRQEVAMPSGMTTFSPDKFKIDSAKALEIVLKELGKQKKPKEKFDFKAKVIGEQPIWQVGRQCQPKAAIKDECDNKDNYVGYVNLENGSFYKEKPE